MGSFESTEDGSSNPKFDFEYRATGERVIQEMYSGSTTVTRAFIYDREDVTVEEEEMKAMELLWDERKKVIWAFME